MEPGESTAPDSDVLYRIAFTACGDHDLSEEAAAECMSRAFITTRRREQSDDDVEGLTMPWYRTVITNFIRDDYRRWQRLRREPAASLEIVLDSADSPDQRAERTEMLGAVAAEFAELPDALRSILQLRIVEGKTMKEASAALGVPIGTLEKRVKRGVAALRERFERRQLAGGITVAGAIGRSGRLRPLPAASAVGAVLVGRIAAVLLALGLGVGGLTWALLRLGSTGPVEVAELDLPTRPSTETEGDAGLVGVADGADGRSPEGSDRAGAAVDSTDRPRGGPSADTAEGVAQLDPYPLHVQIVLDGEPVEGWTAWSLDFEPYAQPVYESPAVSVEPEPDPGEGHTFTFMVPRDPRGKWGSTLAPPEVDGAEDGRFIRFVIDPLAALRERDDGSRLLRVELETRSLTIEDGKLGPGREAVQLLQEVRTGVWAISGMKGGDTGDDLVFPRCFAGRARLYRYDAGWVEPPELPNVDPPWEGWID